VLAQAPPVPVKTGSCAASSEPSVTLRRTAECWECDCSIGDLCVLAGDTHKFESRYLDSLIGRYPEDEAIYKARSPINAVDKLDCPVVLFQGLEDKVVPPVQVPTLPIKRGRG
jgi:hypothetical protein